MNRTWLTAKEGIAEAHCKSARTVTVDIGNTSYKFGLFNSPRLDASRRAGLPVTYPFSIDDLRILPHQLKVVPIWLSVFTRKERQTNQPLLWLVSSVNRTRTEMLLEFLIKKRPQDIFALLDQADVPIRTVYTDQAQLGIDRKLAGLAACRRFQESTPAFIADIGTAVKLDLVNDGVFLGGAIVPGPETEIDSLFKSTDRLPQLNWSARDIPKKYPAVNTTDAIRLGIAGSLAGSICYFYKRALDTLNSPPVPIIITGGGAVGLEPFLRASLSELIPQASGIWIRTVRDLVHTGIELTRQSIVSDL